MKQIRRCIQAVIREPADGRDRHVDPCVGGSIIDIYHTVVIGDPSIGEHDIGHIAGAFFSFRCDEVTVGFCNHPGRIIPCLESSGQVDAPLERDLG